jgi:hypothetical protein
MTYQGHVYDLDYAHVSKRTQVLMRGTPPQPNFVAVTLDAQVACLLATAYADQALTYVFTRALPGGSDEIVRLEVRPNRLTTPPSPTEWAIENVVFELAHGLTRAEFRSHTGALLQGWDDSGHVLRILNAAVTAHEYVEKLVIDRAGRITNLKVNR